jgi:hypothetical protein
LVLFGWDGRASSAPSIRRLGKCARLCLPIAGERDDMFMTPQVFAQTAELVLLDVVGQFATLRWGHMRPALVGRLPG